MVAFSHLVLLASCFLISHVRAQYPPNEFCYRSCELALSNSVQFNVTDPTTGKDCTAATCPCVNALAIGSLYLCNKLYCTESERVESLRALNETCWISENVTIPAYLDVVEKYSDKDILNLKHLSRDEAIVWPGPWPILNEVVVIDESFYKLGHDTLDAAYFELRSHWIYGISMYFFWFVVITIGLTSHAARFIAEQEQKWERIPESDTSALQSSMDRKEHIFRRAYTLLKQYVTVPATFGYRRSQNISWWATIPTRVQSITIGAFIFINIFLCSVSYHIVHGNLYWLKESTQMWRYVADRTGIISTANFILIWAFGIRNNTLMWLTGWDFATYNNFHRWVARVATVEAIVHSVAYTVLILDHGDTWTDSWDQFLSYIVQKYFWNGVLATIFMSLICGFSIYGIRRNYYESFLFLHIVLSIGVLVTMWYHVEIFNGAYNWFLYPCFAIWIFDRLIRPIRVLLFNPMFWRTTATTTYSHDSNIIRLTVPYKTSFVKPRPGTYYYISSLSSLQFWESHPFTLSYSTPSTASLNIDSELSFQPSHGTISPPRSFPSPSLIPADHTSTQISPTIPASADYESETLLKSSSRSLPPEMLTFLIRPYSGFTSRLRTSALNRASDQRVMIDGPYGETQPLHKYDNVLFIVGGAGITVPLSYLSILLSSNSKVESLKVVWAVREEAFLQETVATDFRGLLSDERLQLTAFITGHDTASVQSFENLEQAGSKLHGVQIHKGRPGVRREIEEVAEEIGRNGELAVVACGPAKMADDARASVVEFLGKGWGKMEYFEESFNW